MIDISQKGWFKQYMAFLDANGLPTIPLGRSPYVKIHKLCRENGLLYGYLTEPFFDERLKEFCQQKDDASALMLASAFVLVAKSIKPALPFLDLCQLLYAYTAQISAKKTEGFSYSFIEKYFENKVAEKSLPPLGSFLFFVDLLLWVQFVLQTNAQDLRLEKQRHTHDILLIILSALQSVEQADLKSFAQYLHQLDLDLPLQKSVQGAMQEGIDFSTVHNLPLFFKRFALELCVFLFFSDGQFQHTEKAILQELKTELGVSTVFLREALLGVEQFILENFIFLSEQGASDTFFGKISKRIKRTVKDNRQNLQKEISQSKELTKLIITSRKRALSEEEKAKVKKQLLDIAKTIPSLAIFVLPFGSLILPILLQILPKEYLLPSSFYEED